MRLILAAALVGGIASPSLAQQTCAARDRLTQHLKAGYGESFAGGGLQSETSIIEVWHSEEDGTWTVLLTHADGMSCILASGTHWREALPSERKEGVPG